MSGALDPVLTILRPALPAILTFELFLGGIARLPLGARLIPNLHKRAMSKARGTRDALYFIIPIKEPETHTNFVGVLMCIAGALVAVPATRVPWGAALTLFLTSAGVYSQRRMGIPYWLPVVNSFLTAAMVAVEMRK
jgi:hypothetical protein